MQYPDLTGFSEEERMQLMTVMKKAQVMFAVIFHVVQKGLPKHRKSLPSH